LGLWLALTLAVAPVAGALADCLSDEPTAPIATSDAAPCDTPCKDCSSDDGEKSCLGDCVCVKIQLVSTPVGTVAALMAPRLEPREYDPPPASARPPDTPPPRTILV
jgi:hypothetical protein